MFGGFGHREYSATLFLRVVQHCSKFWGSAQLLQLVRSLRDIKTENVILSGEAALASRYVEIRGAHLKIRADVLHKGVSRLYLPEMPLCTALSYRGCVPIF